MKNLTIFTDKTKLDGQRLVASLKPNQFFVNKTQATVENIKDKLNIENLALVFYLARLFNLAR